MCDEPKFSSKYLKNESKQRMMLIQQKNNTHTRHYGKCTTELMSMFLAVVLRLYNDFDAATCVYVMEPYAKCIRNAPNAASIEPDDNNVRKIQEQNEFIV